jgi:hypothetical protein
MAAGRIALVRCARSIGRDQPQAIDRQGEFLGGDLQQRRLDALSQFGFARENRNAAVTAEPDPGIEIGIDGEAAGQARRRGAIRRLRRYLGVARGGQREAHDKGAPAFEQRATRY